MVDARVPLILCVACSRHVRRTERACPFCDALVVAPPEPTRVLSGRIGRGPIFAFGLAAVAGVALDLDACNHPVYGAPPRDTGISVADAGTDASVDDASGTDAH